MTPQEKLFVEELTMKLFTHAWLNFNSVGSVFVGRIGGYRFIGNHLSLDLIDATEVREFTSGRFDEKVWHSMKKIAYYSFEDILRSNGINNTCVLVSTRSNIFTSVFLLPNGDEVTLTNDEVRVKEIERLITAPVV